MLPDFETRLRAFAEVIVRVGLNLQPGQRLLIAEPYELQGVAREAEVIVNAVRVAAATAGCPVVDVIWGDGSRLRQFAERGDGQGIGELAATNATMMQRAIDDGAALLFLPSSQPRLMDGIPAAKVAWQHRIAWEHFGPIAQQLGQGATNWTVAPAPIPVWAQVTYSDLPSEQRLAALWTDLFAALRVDEANPVLAWAKHLDALCVRRARLNDSRHSTLRYTGEGTDLTVTLPPEHVWCTACLQTKAGLPFVANLPTEEIFTAPDKDSATGSVRVSRPVNYGGAIIDDLELEFARGRVVGAKARIGDDFLQRLLDTDEGARRLGEVAMVESSRVPRGRLFFHPLLDENAANHIALGEAYRFTSADPGSSALNRSLLHLDLPVTAHLELSELEHT